MARPDSSKHYILLALCGVIVIAGAWFAFGTQERPEIGDDSAATQPDANARDSNTPSDSASADPTPESQTDYRFPENARLSIDSTTLTPGEQVTFGLALSAEELGGDLLDVRVASVDGRATDAVALPLVGDNAGAGVALENDWLKPGRYMIQIRTKAKVALPLRRFVLEVR